MNRQLRQIGYVIVVLFVVLIANLVWIQIVDAENISANDANTSRRLEQQFSVERGPILAADGTVLARSVPNPAGPFAYRRNYPEPGLMASVVGFQSLTRTFLSENAFDRLLQGSDKPVTQSSVLERLEGDVTGNTVQVSIRPDVQRAAADALDGRTGAVFALDPKTGAVLASYSDPTYDPNLLTTQSTAGLAEAATALQADPANPQLPRAFREVYPPGSTFKIVTAAAALESGVATPETEYPVLSEIELPNTNGLVLENFDGASCGGSLVESFARSCNTVFAQLARDVGAARLVATAEAFGFNSRPPFELGAVESTIPSASTFATDIPGLMKSGIGQQDVRATPMQMALVAAGVANAGRIMQPQVFSEARDEKGNLIRAVEPREWRTAITPGTAATLRDMMIDVVESGTGRGAQIDGVTVAGKTGTAEAGERTDAWFTGFAPAEDPRVAVAVVVVGGGSGGGVAAPVARAVMEAALQ
ncbi:MAG: penicillin-binding protein 2 [Acidimicrobiia bacterium]|nr:penicillin-binding protein 2 [Acidimicrobiia bacterium]